MAKKEQFDSHDEDFCRKKALGKFISIPLKKIRRKREKVYLHGFAVISHVEVGISQLAVNGTQGSEIVSSGLKRKQNLLLLP